MVRYMWSSVYAGHRLDKPKERMKSGKEESIATTWSWHNLCAGNMQVFNTDIYAHTHTQTQFPFTSVLRFLTAINFQSSCTFFLYVEQTENNQI